MLYLIVRISMYTQRKPSHLQNNYEYSIVWHGMIVHIYYRISIAAVFTYFITVLHIKHKFNKYTIAK